MVDLEFSVWLNMYIGIGLAKLRHFFYAEFLLTILVIRKLNQTTINNIWETGTERFMDLNWVL